MGIPAAYFKIQDDGQESGHVSCRYQFDMKPYIV